MFFIPAYPFWSLMIIAVDIVALYGLCAYGSRANIPPPSSAAPDWAPPGACFRCSQRLAGQLRLLSSRTTAPAAARAAGTRRSGGRTAAGQAECGRVKGGGMSTLTTGVAGQQHARPARAASPDQPARSSAGPQCFCPAEPEPHPHLTGMQIAAGHLNRTYHPGPPGPSSLTPRQSPCNRNQERIDRQLLPGTHGNAPGAGSQMMTVAATGSDPAPAARAGYHHRRRPGRTGPPPSPARPGCCCST